MEIVRSAVATTSPPKAPAVGSTEWTSTWNRLLWMSVAVGFAFRVRELLHARSLWRDEASLVFNLRNRGTLGFTTPLDHDQGTPPGFFVLARAVGRLFGDSEVAYRLVPFVASCLALVFAAILVRRWLSPVAGVVSLGLLAVSWTLIYYSAEVKQYGVDMATTLAIFLVADRSWRRSWSKGACVELGILGSAAILLSYPAVFVLPVVGGAAVLDARRDRRAIARLMLVGGVWLSVLASTYFAWTRDLNNSDFLRQFWRAGFLPIVPTNGDDFEQWGRALETMLAQAFPSRAAWVAALFAVIGSAQLIARRPHLAALVFSPWLLVILASSLELYPAIERSVLFLTPLVAALIGLGVAALCDRMRRVRRDLHIVPAVAVCILASGTAIRDFRDPQEIEEIGPLLATLRNEIDGNTVFVTESSEAAWDYYADRLELAPSRVVAADFERHDGPAALRAASRMEGAGTVWVIDQDFWEDHDVLDPAVKAAFDALGTRLAERHTPGASAYLYDLSR